MNHIFKVVWSKTKHCYVVVSELAGMQGKKSRSEKRSVQRSSMSSSKVSAKWLRAALAAAVLLGVGVSQAEARSWIYLDHGSVGSNEVTDTNKEAVALNPGKNGTNDNVRSVNSKTGIQSVVIGTDAETAMGSVAIGYETKATAIRSIAIGTGALASKNPLGIFNDDNKDGGVEGAGGGQATAVGDGAIASSQATAVGNDVYALGRSSIALGNDDVATYRDAISDYDAKNYFYKLYSKIDPNGEKYGYRVEGNSLVASGARSKLDDGTQTYKNIWSPTLSQGDGSIAIGSRSIAYDAGATALGTLAFALKKGSTAIGTQTRAEGVGALAFGSKSYVFSDNSIAVGSKSQVLKTGGTAYGYRTYAGGNNSIAIGRDVYANAKMKFGTGSNGQEVFSANGLYNFNPAASARTILESSTAVLNTFEDIIKAGGDENGDPGLGIYATAVTKKHNGVENIVQENGQNAIVLGSRSLAQGDNGLALGRGAIERGNNSMAIGSYSMTDGDNAVALGLASRAVAKNSMALGTATSTMGASSLAVGIGAINYGSSSLVLGNTSGIGPDTAGSVVVGTNTIIGKGVNRSIAIGNGASVGSYTRGETGAIIKIDPITGTETSQAIMSIDEMEREDSLQNAMAIGSNARVYSREAVNTTSGDSGYASMNGENAMAIGNNAQAWLENSLALGVDSRTDYTPQQLATDAWRTPDAIAVNTTSKVGVISVGSIGNERRIVNVAAGAYDTDAVNVSQLKQTYESLSRQLNSNTAQSGSHFVSTNYSAIDNGSGVVDYVKKQFMQDTYERYIKAYTGYKGYLVKEQYGGAKLTDTAKQNFNAELTKLENDLRAVGMSQEQINRLMVNTYGGGQKQYASDGTTITGVTVDKASLTDPTVAGAIYQLTKAQQQDIFNVATITGMTADELKDKLSEINYDNSQAQGKGSIAIGYSAGTTQEGGLALGYKAKVLAQDDFVAGSVALGDKSTVSDTDLEATKQAGKQYKTAIAGNASTPNGGVVSVGTTRSDDGYQPITRRIINVAAGYNDTDAVNVAQLKSLAAQEITLQDGQNKKTTAQAIGKEDGVNFTLSGGTNGDITTVASGTTVTFGLNKAASVTNTGADKDKAVTSGAVYTAVSGAKTKVEKDTKDTTGILEVTKAEGTDLAADTYTLSVNTAKLENEMKTSLNDDFAKVDASNLSDSNVTSWRDKLNVYSKEETYSKTEIDNKAKASKTEVVADTNQSAITVNKTQISDGTKPDIYTVGFNSEKLAEATNISYKAGGDETAKTVSLSKGLNFQAGANLTATSAADGQITYGLNSNLTGITSISGPAGKDGTNGTKITITENGIDLGGKTISNIADGEKDTDAATVKQVNEVKTDVTKLVDNTITLTGDSSSTTDAQKLSKEGGISLGIKGGADITTSASGSDVTLSLNKATSVTNTGADKDKVVTSGAVYTAVSGAKTKIAVNPETDGILQVEKTAGTDLAGDTYTLSVNTTKLTDALDDSFAKKDASNIKETEAGQWRTALNIYDKSEVDAATKASKTEVKAADGQSAITVTKTQTSDGTNPDIYTVGFNGDQIATATNIKYKAGSDATAKSVSLAQGLNFQAGANLTATSADDGQITYGLNSDLTGITSITGPAGKDGTNGTKITITENGIDLGGKTISNIADGEKDTDAATVKQVNEVKTDVTKLVDNTITLTGDSSSTTDAQKLSKEGGISFGIKGNEDITTTASGSDVTLSLNKAASVTNTGDDANKVVTSSAVYNAVTGAKTKVAVNPATGGILQVEKTAGTDLAGDTYTLSVNTTKLTDALDDSFAKKDASNIKETEAGQWRTALNIYDKSEVDAATKASKTEVKAKDGQSAITVDTSTNDTDGHTIYTVGFNGDQIATATNIKYKAGDDTTAKSVSLAQGLNFQADANLTAASGDNGQITYGLKSDLTGITSISGPAGKDGTNGTKITITENGIDLGGKTISHIADGTDAKDAATVGQVDSKIKEAKDGITQTITEEVTKVGNNTITLTGDKDTATKGQALNQKDGIKFAITGNSDITTTASESSVALSLSKATSVTNSETDKDKVVTSGAVYTAVTSAKTKVEKDVKDTTGILEVTKAEGTDLAADTYTLSVNTTKLTDALDGSFAKKDASNLDAGDVTNWRDKLNVYSKEETYSKTEIDNKAKASKTEVKAADGQSAITVDTSTNDTDGHTIYTVGFNGDQIATATNISYKAGTDAESKKVSLSKGLNFQAGANLTATSGDNGQITYGLNADLTGITSISGPAGKDGTNGTKITITEKGIDLGGKNISNIADGIDAKDAATVGQVDSKITTAKDGITKTLTETITSTVKTLGDNTITLTGDGSSTTAAQSLNQEGGISFGITGNSDITTTASNDGVALSLNKATSVTNTGADKDKVVTSSAVYDAVKGAKTKVAVNPTTGGILQVEKTEGTGLAADTYTLSVNTAKLENEMKTSLNDDFAKVDASNLTDDNVTSWRNKLNVYSKEETYSKTEVDSKAKASKTEVKAADGQSAITVTKTTSTDETNHDVYTVGFNGEKLAEATNISYKAGSDETAKTVSLSKGLNFQAGANLTATSGNDGQITYGLNADLTGITSISGPAGKDGTNGTTITITEKGIDLGGKTISNVAEGEKDTDAATVKQVNDVKTDVTKLVNNSITLTGDSGTTDKQMLNKDGGISFGITGNTDITTTASKDGVALSLNKATSVTNTGDDANRVVTSNAVYDAVKGAKTKVAVNPTTDGILQVEKTEGIGLAADTYTLSVNTAKLENEMKTSLNDDFAKVDASNLTDDNVTSWRNKLNVYSKEETYSKTEVDSKAKASKTEVKAANGQSAITVTKTISTDGTNHDVYTVGFNGEKLAEATNISYRIGDGDQQSVSLAKGFTFKAKDSNVTVSSDEDGEIVYGLNPNLTGITSITGPTGKDGSSTTITITEKGIDLGGKIISNIAEGKDGKDAATVGQVDSKIKESKDGITQIITEEVTKVGNNTITLTGDDNSKTASQNLNQEGGINFAITGNEDITTKATGNGVALSLNKADSVVKDDTHVVTGGAVYDYVETVKGKITGDINTSITEKVNASKTTLTENTDGPITVTKGTKDGHDNYTIGINSDTMAEALHVAYKAGNDEASKKVTLDKGFDFRASDDNLTVTSGENGIISYGLKANLKGITSISGPSDANGNHTTLTLTEEGLDLGGKKLTGLADGEGPTDAVTMNQFAKVTEKVGERLSEISKRANAGTAGALAAAGIPMITNLNDGNVMIGAGVGSYGGESAVAIGVSGVNTTRDISYRLSTSYDSTGKWGLSGGVGFAFGSGGEHRAALANNKALTKRVQSLETTNQSLTDANDKLQKQLDATNQQLAETNQRLGAKNDQLQQEVAELKALVQQLLENK